MPKLAGEAWNSTADLAEIVRRKPDDYPETFRVVVVYGNDGHAHLEVEREGPLGDLRNVGVMAYENLLVDVVRCVGTDYVEYCATQGVPVDSVRLVVEGRWDLRGCLRPFGIEAPKAARPGWNEILVRAHVRTSAARAATEKAHLVVWQNNAAADSLRAVPTRHEVTVDSPLTEAPARIRA